MVKYETPNQHGDVATAKQQDAAIGTGDNGTYSSATSTSTRGGNIVESVLNEHCDDLPGWIGDTAYIDPVSTMYLAVLAVLAFMLTNRTSRLLFSTQKALLSSAFWACGNKCASTKGPGKGVDRVVLAALQAYVRLPPSLKAAVEADLCKRMPSMPAFGQPERRAPTKRPRCVYSPTSTSTIFHVVGRRILMGLSSFLSILILISFCCACHCTFSRSRSLPPLPPAPSPPCLLSTNALQSLTQTFSPHIIGHVSSQPAGGLHLSRP